MAHLLGATGVRKDEEEGLRLLRYASHGCRGSAVAMYTLAICMLRILAAKEPNLQGRSPRSETSVKATLFLRDAQFGYAKVFEYLLKAAQEGHAMAQYRVGRCLEYGWVEADVHVDVEAAFRWYWLAAHAPGGVDEESDASVLTPSAPLRYAVNSCGYVLDRRRATWIATEQMKIEKGLGYVQVVADVELAHRATCELEKQSYYPGRSESQQALATLCELGLSNAQHTRHCSLLDEGFSLEAVRRLQHRLLTAERASYFPSQQLFGPHPEYNDRPLRQPGNRVAPAVDMSTLTGILNGTDNFGRENQHTEYEMRVRLNNLRLSPYLTSVPIHPHLTSAVYWAERSLLSCTSQQPPASAPRAYFWSDRRSNSPFFQAQQSMTFSGTPQTNGDRHRRYLFETANSLITTRLSAKHYLAHLHDVGAFKAVEDGETFLPSAVPSNRSEEHLRGLGAMRWYEEVLEEFELVFSCLPTKLSVLSGKKKGDKTKTPICSYLDLKLGEVSMEKLKEWRRRLGLSIPRAFS